MLMISSEEIRARLDWAGALQALHKAHLGPRPIGDSYFVGDSSFGLFSRGVISPRAGAGFKLATICPGNMQAIPARPSEQGLFLVVDETTKAITAALDGAEITRWKTAADSALAARKLARADSSTLLAVGSGPVAHSLILAYLHIRPALSNVLLWNRTPEKLEELHGQLTRAGISVSIATDLDEAVRAADIITCATGATSPLIRAACVQPGTHLDLVGGYRADMQEAEALVLQGAVVYVDDWENALQSGDVQLPIQQGIITKEQIRGDLFDLCQDREFTRPENAVTVYKNAGGAHLDLALSKHVIDMMIGRLASPET